MFIAGNFSVTQQESTRVLYRKHYSRLAQMTRKFHAVESDEAVTPQQVAETFVRNESDWAQSTARLYRASLVFVYEEMNNAAGKEACDIVYHTAESPEQRMQRQEKVRAERKVRKRNRPRTSQQKAKNISPEDMHLLRKTLGKSHSKYAKATIAWFFATVLTGLRPVEWRRAVLQRNEKNELILVIKNAKNTNKRSHGETRTIGLGEVPESNLSIITQHLDNVKIWRSAQSFDFYYSRCRQLLQNTADILWPRRRKHPTLYTARHIFSADAKNTFDRIEVAALMGHASTDTAYRHYGKRHTGTGGMAIIPDQKDMEAVIKRNPNYVAGTLNSERPVRFSPRSTA